MNDDGRRRARGAGAYRRGVRAEQLAALWLRDAGWTILLRRARTAWGEIDLVAARDDMLVFAEVKSRPLYDDDVTASEGAILGARQAGRLMNAAAALCAANPHWRYAEMRFDVLLVTADDAVHRIEDAFRLE
ncbi:MULTISPECIES: YraN family protein [Nguyenibacter]|uniref:UPF0102 protein AAC691_02555 n=1 Tax=Nguyenibacter vanlangensis TaxID=1216886 RepID=A0A7Y7M4W0_9PROT|nr:MULTISPECIES: YraN family protein [Nguyenibacter]NVN11260.1 YraN family protein [Nguyenibacter vanlangensis]WRH88170.1 YraN family protein [Nguyenibacter sp. L1]